MSQARFRLIKQAFFASGGYSQSARGRRGWKSAVEIWPGWLNCGGLALRKKSAIVVIK
jgi:hypothetical protein